MSIPSSTNSTLNIGLVIARMTKVSNSLHTCKAFNNS